MVQYDHNPGENEMEMVLSLAKLMQMNEAIAVFGYRKEMLVLRVG